MAETRRTALITGASSGMGKETALALIQAGYDVYGAARRINQMADIVAAGGHSLELDITDEKSIVSACYIYRRGGRRHRYPDKQCRVWLLWCRRGCSSG